MRESFNKLTDIEFEEYLCELDDEERRKAKEYSLELPRIKEIFKSSSDSRF